MEGPWAKGPNNTCPLDGHQGELSSVCMDQLEDWLENENLTGALDVELAQAQLGGMVLGRCYSLESSPTVGRCGCSDLFYYRGGMACQNISWVTIGLAIVNGCFLVLNVAVMIYGVRFVMTREVSKRKVSLSKNLSMQATILALFSVFTNMLIQIYFFVVLNIIWFQPVVLFLVGSVRDVCQLASLFLMSLAWDQVANLSEMQEDRVTKRHLMKSCFSKGKTGMLAVGIVMATIIVMLSVLYVLWIYGIVGHGKSMYIVAKSVTLLLYLSLFVLFLSSAYRVYRVTKMGDDSSNLLVDLLKILLSVNLRFKQTEENAQDAHTIGVFDDSFLMRVRIHLVRAASGMSLAIITTCIGLILLMTSGSTAIFLDNTVGGTVIFKAIAVNMPTVIAAILLRYFRNQYDDPSKRGGKKGKTEMTRTNLVETTAFELEMQSESRLTNL